MTEFSDRQALAYLDYSLSHLSKDMALSIVNALQHILTQISDLPPQLLLQDIDLCPISDREVFRRLTEIVPE